MDLQVKDNKGKVVGSVTASDQVWGAPGNEVLLHQAVLAQQANKRRGTQDTQTRAQVSYSTRKIRPQKGTGAARQGSRRSPTRVGGGVAHGSVCAAQASVALSGCCVEAGGGAGAGDPQRHF